MAERILLVDDDVSICALVADVLRDNGLEVDTATAAEVGLRLAKQNAYDLMILDVMMQGMDGFSLCSALRGTVSCPIIFLSARDSSADVVKGLSIGADDYLTKPFVLDELVARINAHLRRQSRVSAPADKPEVLEAGEIKLNLGDRSVWRAGEPVALSTKEFELLAYLMRNAGKTISRERLFREVWNTTYGDVGTVAIHIKNLRAKIDPDWAYIKTIWGSGYRFAVPENSEWGKEP